MGISDTQKAEKALKELKDEHFDGSALLLMDDDLTRMVVAWPKVMRSIERWDSPDDSLPEAWGWVKFAPKEWARLSRVPEAIVWVLWKTLAVNRLIYPDGDVPDKVREYILHQSNILLGHKDKPVEHSDA